MCVGCKWEERNPEAWIRSKEETLRNQKFTRERRFLETKAAARVRGVKTRNEHMRWENWTWMERQGIKAKRRGLGFYFSSLADDMALELFLLQRKANQQLKTFYSPNISGVLQLVKKGNWICYKFKMPFGNVLGFAGKYGCSSWPALF